MFYLLQISNVTGAEGHLLLDSVVVRHNCIDPNLGQLLLDRSAGPFRHRGSWYEHNKASELKSVTHDDCMISELCPYQRML